MAFTKLQGVSSDAVGVVMRGFTEDDWRDAETWLDEVLSTHAGDAYVYARVLELSGADTSGVTDATSAGYGIATRIRERASND